MSSEFIALPDQPVEMRDGTLLSANIWLPREHGTFPAVLLRTPYGNDAGEFERLGLARYVKAGYAVVFQRVRGRPPSGGEFEFFFNEQDDGHDSVEWVAARSWCDGRVAMDGGSYLGTAQYLAARAQPPSLVAIIPSVPAGDFFDEVPYLGGALQFDHVVNWSAAQDGIDVESREQEIRELMLTVRPLERLGREIAIDNPYYYSVIDRDSYAKRLTDLFYTAEDFRHLADLPVMTVSGWFDGDQAGALRYWEGIERYLPDAPDKYLIIGPWDHRACYLGGEQTQGQFDFGVSASIDIQAERLRFLQRVFGESAATAQAPDRVRLFITGSNQWRSYPAYPPPVSETAFYLHSEGRANSRHGDGYLSRELPAAEPADHYVFDPTDPVEYQEFGEDLSEAETRQDVLVYSSDELEAPLEIVGPLWLVLYAASDAQDTDFAVRIADVFPDGSSVNLSHSRGVMRARYRNSYLEQELLQQGEVVRLRIRLNDLGHVFGPGHRLRLEITSSLFPLVDPNPNTGTEIMTEATLRSARQSVYHDSRYPSHVLVPVTSEQARYVAS